MARPKANPNQHMKAYELYRQGNGPTAIADVLSKSFENPVSERTVGTWIRGFKTLDSRIVDLDGPFEWHRMEEYELPWEAGEFLLRAWRNMEGVGFLGLQEPRTPTIREMRWWWRLHLAAPDLKAIFGFWWLSAQFCQRELRHEVLHQPLRTDDLEWVLFYKPWLIAGMAAYKSALSQGLIPALALETESDLKGLPRMVLTSKWHRPGQESEEPDPIASVFSEARDIEDSTKSSFSIYYERWETE